MKLLKITLGAGLFALAACGGNGDDALGEQAKEAMDNRADAMDATADNMTGSDQEVMETRADATREMGEAKEEAIDDADVDADEMTQAQKDSLVNAQQ